MDNDDIFQKLIAESESGDEEAKSQLWEQVYSEMKKLAHYRLARSKPVSISPTMLVHEVFLKMDSPEKLGIANKSHFMALICRAMRFILADYSRRKGAVKRGSSWRRTRSTMPVNLAIKTPSNCWC